ncbi:MAG TPA: hypothetical protein VKX17_24630 [Planctomycetota bacterium]|nr:hypothetical protein [Planctomycetota bacterium]
MSTQYMSHRGSKPISLAAKARANERRAHAKPKGKAGKNLPGADKFPRHKEEYTPSEEALENAES